MKETSIDNMPIDAPQEESKWSYWKRKLTFSSDNFVSFLTRNAPLLILIIGLILFYISNRYACRLMEREIDKRKMVLNKVESEYIDLYTKLKDISRPIKVLTKVKEQDLNLEIPKYSPYVIEFKTEKE